MIVVLLSVGPISSIDGQKLVSTKDSVLYWIELSDQKDLEVSERTIYAEKALEYAKKNNLLLGRIEANTSLGAIALEQYDYNKALKYLQQTDPRHDQPLRNLDINPS